MKAFQQELVPLIDHTFTELDRLLASYQVDLVDQEFGVVEYAGHGIARVRGLPNVQLEELVHFEGGSLGMIFNLDADETGVILLGAGSKLGAGAKVFRTKRVMDTPVGPALLGRVVDATGQPLDGGGPLRTVHRLPVERPAPAIIQRDPVSVPLQTGIKVIDALLPIGRGQRELILGDRQTGKSTLALDTVINQRGKDVLCVYCCIGQRNATVAKLIADLQAYGAMKYCIVVVTSGADSPGLQYIAPYAATSMAEYFMERGRDVLIVYDDLTNHARAYRELALLLRRPPGREAFPGDIFYIHSRLLERATHLRAEYGGGSLTALPIIATEAQNLSAYIPTNLISITDGQIYLSPDLFQKGLLPAVEVGRSVSRVGSKAQLPAYRSVTGDLRLAYAQYEELEVFSRFSTRLDARTRKTLERGRRVREVLKQPQYQPQPVAEQLAVLLAVAQGVLDTVPLDKIAEAEQLLRKAIRLQLPQLYQDIEAGQALSEEDRKSLLRVARRALAAVFDEKHNADT